MVESAKVEKKLDAARTEIMARQHLQTRLQDLLSTLERGPPLYTKQFPEQSAVYREGFKNSGISLIGIFNNGIDPDPAFSGSVTGRVYLDEEQNLCLAIWPLSQEKNRPWRKEILLPGVAGFEFVFLLLKNELDQNSFKWCGELKKTHPGTPSMIRLLVEKTDHQLLQFAFLVPSFEIFPTYWESP